MAASYIARTIVACRTSELAGGRGKAGLLTALGTMPTQSVTTLGAAGASDSCGRRTIPAEVSSGAPGASHAASASPRNRTPNTARLREKAWHVISHLL